MLYVITSNITGTDPVGRYATGTGTAATISAALDVFAGQLRRALPVGGVRWTIVDPTGTEHPGHITLNGRVDLLDSAVNELCDELYVELHRMADGYRGV